MSELKIESTNGGSIAKIAGGQMIVNPKQQEVKVPPKSSSEARCSNKEEDYITIALVQEKQQELKEEQDK